MESCIIDPTGTYFYSNIRAAKDHYNALRETDIYPEKYSFYKNSQSVRKYNPDAISRSIFNQTQFNYKLKLVK